MATPLEQYIRQAAAARGINPDVAVRVAKSEGGLSDPTRQSLVTKNGRREPSYGPFQMLVGGGNTGFPEGLGNRALAAGIDPRNPADAYRTIDFALDQAKQGGWSPWYGAKAAGIPRWGGINGQAASAPSLSPQAADFVKNNPQPGGFGTPVEQAAGIAPPAPPAPFGSFAPRPPADNSTDPRVAAFATGDDKDTWGNRLANAGQAFDAAIMPAPRPSAFPGGPSSEQANGLLKATSNIDQLAKMLLQRRTV